MPFNCKISECTQNQPYDEADDIDWDLRRKHKSIAQKYNEIQQKPIRHKSVLIAIRCGCVCVRVSLRLCMCACTFYSRQVTVSDTTTYADGRVSRAPVYFYSTMCTRSLRVPTQLHKYTHTRRRHTRAATMKMRRIASESNAQMYRWNRQSNDVAYARYTSIW